MDAETSRIDVHADADLVGADAPECPPVPAQRIELKGEVAPDGIADNPVQVVGSALRFRFPDGHRSSLQSAVQRSSPDRPGLAPRPIHDLQSSRARRQRAIADTNGNVNLTVPLKGHDIAEARLGRLVYRSTENGSHDVLHGLKPVFEHRPAMRSAASWSRSKRAKKSVVREREKTLARLNSRALKRGF
jgi:hypothetical protein